MRGRSRRKPVQQKKLKKALVLALTGAMVGNSIGVGTLDSFAAEVSSGSVVESEELEKGPEETDKEIGEETEGKNEGSEETKGETEGSDEETEGSDEETEGETEGSEEETEGSDEETEGETEGSDEETEGSDEETEGSDEETEGETEGSDEETEGETEGSDEETEAPEEGTGNTEDGTGTGNNTDGESGGMESGENGESAEKDEADFVIDYTYDETLGTVKGPKKVDQGDSLYFTVIPEEGCAIASVTANGMDLDPVVTATSSEMESGEQNFILLEVEEDTEIEVVFTSAVVMSAAEIPVPDSVGDGVEYKEMSEFVVPDMESIVYDKSNGTRNFKMDFQILENDEDELTVVLDDSMLYGLENYADSIMPGHVFNWDFTFNNLSKNSYRYKEGSLVVAPADMSSLIEEDYEKYGTDFPHSAGYDGQLIPSIYSKHRCKDSAALAALYGKDTTKITLEDMLQIYDTLAEKGYEGEEALTRYYLDFYNEKYGSEAQTILELPQAAQDDIMVRNGGFNGIFNVSSMEEIDRLDKEYEYFHKYALVNTSKKQVELLEIEPQLASLIYDDWYNIGLGMTVGERADKDSSMDPSGCGYFGIGKYMTGLSDVWDETNSKMQETVVLNEAGNCVLPVGLVFSFWKIGNINQSYPIDFYVAFDLERVITEGSITINKVDDDGNLIDIPAAFKLYKMDGDRKLYYTGSEWSEDEAQGAEFVTSEGTVTIPSLELGVYYIQEVRAPEGYELVTEPYQVNLDGEAVTVNFSNKIQYTIIINYYEKDTTTKLADTYTSEPYTRGDAYNVADLVNKVIDGYNWDSCDQSVYEGVMSGNLIFNVYYTRVTDPGDGGDPDGGNPGGGNNGGGSSGSGPRNPYNPGGGPGVATEIDPGEVPLADLPNEIPTEIPQEEVPLAGLPKTGQSRNAGTWMAMIAGLVTAVYALIGGKKKEAE